MTAAVILAAGASRRLGRTKQLLPFHGTTLLRAVAEEVLASSCRPIAIVLGAESKAIIPSLDGLPVSLLDNPDWHEGLSASIRVATAWAMAGGHDALLLCVGDQPRITRAHLDNLIAIQGTSGTIAASGYAGTIGVPAIFPRAVYPQLLALRGDEGARRVIAGSTVHTVEWPAGAEDIDTPEAAARLSDP